MNPEPPPAPPRIGLPPDQFAAAFPFHMAVDRDLNLLQVGSTLRRICPDTQPGANLGHLFHSIQPHGRITRSWVLDNARRFFLLEHLATKLQLRGEFVVLRDSDTLLFLGSPWFTDSAEIADRNLHFEDFAIHDPVVDMLQVYQANKIALADARRLAAKLTAQRTELRAANERLRQQEAETRKLALIAARTDNAVVLTDAEGRTEWVNEGFTRQTGYTLDEMLGKRPGALLQGPATDPETVRRISQRLRAGQGFREEILNYGKDGRSYWISIEAQPIQDETGRLTHFMAIEADITTRRAAQQRLAIQFEVSKALAEVGTVDAAISRVLKVVCSQLGGQVGQFWRVKDDRLQFADTWFSPTPGLSEFVEASRAMEFGLNEGLPGIVWASQAPSWMSDVTEDKRFLRIAAAAGAGLRGGFAFPVMVQGRPWGVMEFYSRNIEEPDEALLQAFATVGNQIGQFVVRCAAEDALRKTYTMQRAILDGARYSIISADPRGIIRTFNAGAERMLGYTSAEMVGKLTPAVIHDPAEVTSRAAELSAELGREIQPGFEVFVAKAALGNPEEREWTYIRKDGSRFPVLLSVTALFDEQEGIIGYLGIASDITERRRFAQELLKAKEAAEAASRAKSDFLATMSHEIRTPMNAVLGMTNLLLESPLNPQQKEFAQTVARSGEALLEIINDILDFSKIESGEQFQLEVESFSLAKLVDDVIRLLRPRAESRGLTLTAELATGTPDALKSDDGRIRQVLVNLVANGIKFTDAGKVAVHVGSRPVESGRFQLRFEVRDTGIGISPENLARLFKPFTQADSSHSRRRGGTGLGLAICKSIVEKMGGCIGVRSTPGLGSLFWFELEVDRDATPPSAMPPQATSASQSAEIFASVTNPGEPGRPLRILVAEDHDINRRLAMFMLENLGHRADFAGNGVEAVEAWERSNYDVIFMDCQMPEMDGFDATREIRRREALRPPTGKRVRIIALTANALKGDRDRCLAAGMDGYISKPFTAQQLRSALETSPGRPAIEPTGRTSPEAPASLFDPDRPAQLSADLGDDAVAVILDDFLSDLPGQTSRLASFVEARRTDDAGRLAHSMQGITASFGLVQLSSQLLLIEELAGRQDVSALKQHVGTMAALATQSASELRNWIETRRLPSAKQTQ